MKSNKFRGLDQVFQFTLTQTFKNKTYLISFLLFVVMMSAMPVIMKISGNAGASAATAMERELTGEDLKAESLILINNTEVPLTNAELQTEDSILNALNVTVREGSEEDVDALLGTLTETDILLYLTVDTNGTMPTPMLSAVVSDESKITPDESETLADAVSAAYDTARKNLSSLSASAVSMMAGGITVEYTKTEAEFFKGDELGYDQTMGISLIYSVALMILISMSISYIITALVEEKSTKLVDMLLTSVTPMALVFGKVLAMMCYTFSMVLVGGIGAFTTSRLMGVQMNAEAVTNMLDFSPLLNPVAICAVVISFILGYMIFASFAAIAGAAATSQEDAQGFTGLVMMLCMVGYVAAMILPAVDNKIVATVAALIPIVSTYIAPPMLVAGRIGLPVFIAYLVINIGALSLLLLIGARTYRELATNDSKKMKLKDIWNMAFPGKGKNAGKEAAHV
jgi:ABC-type Na+ efflux pump permease subunit